MAQRWVLLVLAFILCHVTFGVKLPKFFYVAKSGATLEQCRRSCDATSGGAYPATIQSAADNAAIGALFPSNSAYRGVIGGTRLVGNNNSFRWVAGPLQSESNGLGRMFFNGTTLGNGYCVSGMYCHFSSGEPNADPTHPDGPEAQLEFTSADNMWNDIPNGFPALTGCICQRPRTSTATRSAEVSHEVSASRTSSTSSSILSVVASSPASASLSSSRTVTLSISDSTTLLSSSTASATTSDSTTSSPSLSMSTATASMKISRGSETDSITSTDSQSNSRKSESKSFFTKTIQPTFLSTSVSLPPSPTKSIGSVSASASCGLAPLVMFFAASSVGGTFGGGLTSLQIPVTDLLFSRTITFWLSAPLEFVGSWTLASRQSPTGAGAGATLTITQIRNMSMMPDDVSVRALLGETVWRVVVTSPAHGWLVTSTSRYVTQNMGVYVSFLCANGGVGANYNYAVIINAIGDPLPFTPAYQIGTTFSQSMGQIASGTVIPTSLSTMRALARLASCGTTDSGADTSYGIVSVLVPVLAPLHLLPNAEITALNMLMCVIVAGYVTSLAMGAYVFLCRSVPIADLFAHFHLPSLLAPSVMFAFPTVLGTSIAIFASTDYASPSSFVVGVMGLIFSTIFIAWITVSTAWVGPRRVVVIRLPTQQPPSFPSSNKQSSVVLMRLPLWVAASLTHVRTRTFLWKGLKMAQYFDTKTTSQTNVQWKHGYHILIQDVRFLLVPVAEAICATVATVTTALVVVPGVGCQTAICVIAIFYAAQTLLFLWIRPYSSTMMQVFAALTNVLTLLATIALALDIFQVEQTYGMRLSVAFQLMLLGVSVAKSAFDVLEFVEGSRRLWRWIMTQHETRMAAAANCNGATLTVHYYDDDAVSDDDVNIMMTSVNAEGPPRTPLQGFTAAHASRFSARSSSVMSGSGSSISDVLSQKSVSIRRAESVRSGSSEASHSDAIPSFPNYSFGGIAVDEDAIDRRLRERQREGGVVAARSLRVAPLTWNGSYTAFMVDEMAEVPRLSSAARTSPSDVSKSQL